MLRHQRPSTASSSRGRLRGRQSSDRYSKPCELPVSRMIMPLSTCRVAQACRMLKRALELRAKHAFRKPDYYWGAQASGRGAVPGCHCCGWA